MVIRSRDSAAVRAAAEAVLHVVDAAVASLAEGYTEARRQMVRWEETLRREFIEDLLRGDADLGRLVERAEPFGLDMARPHQVALAAPTGRLDRRRSRRSARWNARSCTGSATATCWWPPRTAGSSWSPPPTPTCRPRPGHGGPHRLGDFMLAELNRSRTRPALAGHRGTALPRLLRHPPLLRGSPRGPDHGRAAAPGHPGDPRRAAAHLPRAAARSTRHHRPGPVGAGPTGPGPRRSRTPPDHPRRLLRHRRRQPPKPRAVCTCPSARSPTGSTGSGRSPATTPPIPRSGSPSTPRCSARDCSAGQNTI